MVLLFVRDIPWDSASGSRLSLKSQFSYGARAFIASLLAFLLLRINLLMVQQMAGNGEAGQYSVAMAFFDGIYLLPATIGLILFPRLSAMESHGERWQLTLRMAGASLALLALIAGAVALAADPLITLLFGTEFRPAVPLLYVLLLAAMFYGVNGIVSVFLAACGMPWLAVWVWAPALAANIALNVAWIPIHGAVGAAWSCVASYLLVLVVQFVFAWRAR
jgi:O-antigen/teichoic acid export membrane protein